MSRYCRIGAALIILAGLTGISVGQNKTAVAFTLRLPGEVSPETVRIDVDVRGKSHWWTRLATQKGTYEYAVPFRYGSTSKAFEVGDAKTLKVFIHAPGFQAIEREFQSTDLTAPRTYEVVLQKQQTATLQGLLVDSQFHPLAGQSIRLEYDAGCDGPDCILNPMEFARTTTGPDGTFQFEVPLLGDTDPVFQLRRPGTFSFTTDVGILRPEGPGSQNNFLGWFTFAPQPAYPARMTVMRVVPGSISLKLGPSFLKQNKLPKSKDASIQIELKGGDSSGSRVWPGVDSKYGISALAGTYSLTLHHQRGAKSTEIRIAEGIVVKEGEATVVRIP